MIYNEKLNIKLIKIDEFFKRIITDILFPRALLCNI